MRVDILSRIGLFTWAIIGIPSVHWQLNNGGFREPRALGWGICFLLFLVFYLCSTRAVLAPGLRYSGILVQSVLALACTAFQPSGFQPVLLVIVASQLGIRSYRAGIAGTVLQTVALGFILWETTNFSNPAGVALAYFAFQMFSVYTTHIAHSESIARRELAEVNTELKVTAGLLEINSRTSERLRIARDLHDLLGHHLTALALNLEVASHLAEGRVLEQVEHSRRIAKTLLGDVREVVSRLRDDEPVDLGAALRSIGGVIPTPAVHLDLPADCGVHDSALAQVALRGVQEIVTNCVRHAGARNLYLKVSHQNEALVIEARDDGRGAAAVNAGNGLIGLRERVEQANGTLEIHTKPGEGFSLRIELPPAVHA